MRKKTSTFKQGEFLRAAKTLTDLIAPVPSRYDSTLKRVMAELSELCGNKAREKGNKVYDLEDVLEAFPKMQSEFKDANITVSGIGALLNGNPPRIEKYLQIEPQPAVWDSSAHSNWVRRNAKRLKKQGYIYNGWVSAESQGSLSRLSYDEVSEMGLLPQ